MRAEGAASLTIGISSWRVARPHRARDARPERYHGEAPGYDEAMSTPRRSLLRRGPGTAWRRVESLRFLLTRDRREVLRFLRRDDLVGLGATERLGMIRSFLRVTHGVRGYHTLAEMLEVAAEILARRGRTGPTVVECGVAKGSSTAKLSLATRRAGGRLIAFDSFQGIPENDETHRHLDGRRIVFRKGAFRGTLAGVSRTLEELGAPEVVELRKGLFEESLRSLEAPVDVAFVDVDLLASVRTCLAALWPRMSPDGVLFSHDGHLEAACRLIGSEGFWREEIGTEPPRVEGLGARRLLRLTRSGS